MVENFRIIEMTVVGDIDVIVNTQFNNLNADKVIVHENVTARLYGNINKLLVLKAGAKVFLHGILSGDFRNEGGELHVFRKE